MALDKLFGDGNDVNNEDKENQRITDDKTGNYNEQLEKEKDFKALMSNGKQVNDPSAARYTGAEGYTQRSDQKNQLENLHIGGSETEPQGGNDHHNTGEQAQGPGFETEGSYELDHQLRTKEQKFGESEPSGPSKPVQE